MLDGASIAGVKYLTANASGFSPADTPMGGVAINLYADNGDTIFDPLTDTLVDSSVTAPGTGLFEFDNVADGLYFVAEAVPPGFVQSAGPAYYTVNVVGGIASAANSMTIDDFSSPDPEHDYFINGVDPNPFQLSTSSGSGDIIGGQRDLTVNVLGVANPISANGFVGTIGTGDGVFNLGSASSGPATQVTMLYNADGSGLAADLTANGGNGFRFDFDFLQVGTGTSTDMEITLVGPTGSATLSTNVTANTGAFSVFTPFTSFTPSGTFSFANVSSIQFDFNSNGVQDTDFELNQVIDTGLSFGNFPQTAPTINSLSGFVYVDSNNNGTKDAGEPPIAGAIVTLYDNLGNALGTNTTDANGHYFFENLPNGTYTLRETQPINFIDGKDSIGSQGGTAGNDVFSDIVLTGGIDGVNNNFGELGLTPACASKRSLLVPAQPVDLVAVNPGTDSTPAPATNNSAAAATTAHTSVAATTASSHAATATSTAKPASVAATPAATSVHAAVVASTTAKPAATTTTSSAKVASTTPTAKPATTSTTTAKVATITSTSKPAAVSTTSAKATTATPTAKSAPTTTSKPAAVSTTTAKATTTAKSAAAAVSTSTGKTSSSTKPAAAVSTITSSTAAAKPAATSTPSTSTASVKMFLVSLTKPKY